jgi:hypothetical protein
MRADYFATSTSLCKTIIKLISLCSIPVSALSTLIALISASIEITHELYTSLLFQIPWRKARLLALLSFAHTHYTYFSSMFRPVSKPSFSRSKYSQAIIAALFYIVSLPQPLICHVVK